MVALDRLRIDSAYPKLLFADAALVRGRDLHVLPVLRHRAAGHLMPSRCSIAVICSSVSGLVRILLLDHLLDLALQQQQRRAAARRPCTASEKKYRSSKTPCGVCTYLLATARLTVEGCTPTSSATSLIIIGFS